MVQRSWRTPDERFEIRWDYQSGGITYDEEFDEDWTVVDLTTGEKLKRFVGNGRKTFESTYRGVKAVEFSRHFDEVIATHYDGTVERLPLPGARRAPWWHRLFGRFL